MRVVPNLYPAFEGDEPFVVANRGPVFTQASAGGIHEILIFSPEHDATLGQLSQEQVELVMAALRDRLEEHASQPNLRYTQAIVNSGREAGASLEHPHGQLLGMSFIPRELAEEQARFARFVGSCLLCTTIEAEEDSTERVIYANDRVVVVCPFWSAVPYEMLVMPREHNPHLHRSPTEDLIAVGEAIRRTLQQLAETVGDVAYNIVFHSAPYRVGEPYHWHAHIWPKATTTAGFELGTGVAINVISPEEAAETLKVSALASEPSAAAHRAGQLQERHQAPDQVAVGPDQAPDTRACSGSPSRRHAGSSPPRPARARPARAGPWGPAPPPPPRWPGASTTAGRPRRPRGCAVPAWTRRPGRRPGAQSLTTQPWSVRAVRPRWKSPWVRMTGSRPSDSRIHLTRSATPGASSSDGSAAAIVASASSTQSATGSWWRRKARSRARCIRAVMVPSARASAPKSPPAASGDPPDA